MSWSGPRSVGGFGDRTIAERVRLGLADPDGEAEAVHPLRLRTAAEIAADADDMIAATPLKLGWRTLADVPDDAPGPLLFGMLEDGPTLMYAAPGTGKGMTGAFLIVEAQRAGMLPAVFDAERRPREWARRVSGLRGDRSRVVYMEPADLGLEFAGRPFWEVAPQIRKITRASGADLLLLDSLLPASGIGEEQLRSDARAPFHFVAALDLLGIPSASFGHPPRGSPKATRSARWPGLRPTGSPGSGRRPKVTVTGFGGAPGSATSGATFPAFSSPSVTGRMGARFRSNGSTMRSQRVIGSWQLS